MPGKETPLVGLVTPSLGRGGLERMVLDLALALPDRGFRVEVLCTAAPGSHAQLAREAGVEVRDCSPARGALRIPGVPLRLARAIVRPPQILHAHGGAFRAAAIAALRFRSAKLVFTEHGIEPSGWRGWADRLCAMRADAIVAVSREVAVALEQRLHRPAEIVPNGIDASAIERAGSRREEVRRTLSLNPGALLVVAIGRLEPVKDHATLLRAFAIAAREVPTLVLAIAGAGSLEGTLRSQATALEVAAKVRFLGHREDVPALLRAADLFAITSLSEGLPLALVEALAAQLPAIASAIPGNLDALGTPCAGLVVAAGDHAALAQALVRLARDAPLRSDLSSLAGARARAFSRETMIDRHCLLYERLLAGRR